MARPATDVAPAGGTRRRARRWAVAILCATPIVGSAAWVATSAGEIGALRARFDEVTVVVLALAVTGTCFAVGLAGLAATCLPFLGRAAGGTRRGSRWPDLRRELPGLVDDLATNPWFFRSWILNSIGTLGPCIVLVVAVVALLPAPAWGLALLPAADLVVSAAARLPIHVAIVRRRAAPRSATSTATSAAPGAQGA